MTGDHDQPEPRTNPFTSVPIEIVVSVGRARPMVKDLLNIGPSSVLELDHHVNDPVELYVGDKLIAKGNLEEHADPQNDRICVRLTKIFGTGPAE